MLNTANQRWPGFRGLALGCTLALVGSLLVAGTAEAAPEQVAPIFGVTQEGLTQSEGKKLAGTFDIPNALETTGSFSYVDTERFNQVPLVQVGEGKDESGRPTVSQAVDLAAIKKIKPVSDEQALSGARKLVEQAGLSPEMAVEPQVSHSELTLADERDRPSLTQPLDTTVSHRITLAGLPVTGQGARLRITFAPDGTVSQLSHALRKVVRVGEVAVISEAEATSSCAALYPSEVRQLTPTLGYQFPELTASNADGKGTIATIYPQYTCNPVAESGTQAHRLVPAVPDASPRGDLKVTRRGDTIEASVSVAGGSKPQTYGWSSSSTVLPSDRRDLPEISYQRTPREKSESAEQVTVELTDANGLTATASVTLAGDGSASATTVPGGGGFGELAIGPLDVGIEQTVDEWQCAQDSANGFRSVMASQGVPTAFDWRGNSAWEWDFKDQSLGGGDNYYVDNVDAAWYTGHGSASGFTFKSNVNDHWITPADARWGNGDLEWLQLESCQVLRDTNGKHDYFARWRPALRGLHILNGFHTNAYCVGGGTGRTFAEYLFPKKFLFWTLRPAQRVQVAWAQMAINREPRGVVYRSMGPWRPSDGVSNIGDYFWGQGPVGPDLPMSATMGMWSISGTV